MTTLAAIQGNGWAVIGCDSRSSDESGRPIDMATHKIIENNGIFKITSTIKDLKLT